MAADHSHENRRIREWALKIVKSIILTDKKFFKTYSEMHALTENILLRMWAFKCKVIVKLRLFGYTFFFTNM